MSEVIWIESDASAAQEVPYRVVSAHDALAELEGGRDFDVAVLGTTVSEPVRLARSLRMHDDIFEILIVCTSEKSEALAEAVRLDPLIGGHTRTVSTTGSVIEEVSLAAEATERRRNHRQAIRRAQSALETGPSSMRRPSPLHYAATMWSESPVGALGVVRGSHHIVSANHAATKLLEEDELDLIGKRLDEVLPSRGDQGWSWLADLGKVGGGSVEREVTRQASGGELLHLEARAVAVEAPGKDVLLVFLWDVTERVRLEQLQQDYLSAEMRAREHAEEASRAREEVLATVSHDLRSPLQTLLTAAELLAELAEHHNDSTVADVGATVSRAAGYMDRLVDDLLDIARIEDGGLSLDCSYVEVATLVEQVVELTSGLAAEQGVQVETPVIPEALVLCCDRMRVVQMLQNLLNNAIKFSPEEQAVTVDVEQRGDMVRFTISDFGPGIPADELPRLFDRFWQADRRGRTGLGLGLAIVRGVVDAHDGEIKVDSEVGEGTTFLVELPLSGPESCSAG